MNDHTPGPWNVSRLGPSYIEQTGGSLVASAIETRGDSYLANARLIAAAPELLAALDNLAGLIEDYILAGYDFNDDTTAQARSAIAKARGEDDAS